MKDPDAIWHEVLEKLNTELEVNVLHSRKIDLDHRLAIFDAKGKDFLISYGPNDSEPELIHCNANVLEIRPFSLIMETNFPEEYIRNLDQKELVKSLVNQFKNQLQKIKRGYKYPIHPTVVLFGGPTAKYYLSVDNWNWSAKFKQDLAVYAELESF